jgi:hypothetical protein
VRTGKIRTIIRDHRFELEMDYIEPNVRRADEFMEGAEEILSRDPEVGCQLNDSRVWFACGHTVDVALYYTFDADHVYLLSIKRTKMPEL